MHVHMCVCRGEWVVSECAIHNIMNVMITIDKGSLDAAISGW